MNIKNRIIKLEKLPRNIDIKEVRCRLKALVGKHLGLDLNSCADTHSEEHITIVLCGRWRSLWR